MSDLDWMPVVEREPRERPFPQLPRTAASEGTWSGFIDRLKGVPTGQDVDREIALGKYGPQLAERMQQSGFSRDEESSQAQSAILQRVAQMKEEKPYLNAQQLITALTKDRVFTQNALQVKDPVKLVNDAMGLLSPEVGKPVVIPEGGLLSTPEGKALLKNPKSASDKIETEREKITVKKAYDMIGKISEEGNNAQEDLANLTMLEQSLARSGPTGIGAALRSQAAAWGIPVKGADDLQLAKIDD